MSFKYQIALLGNYGSKRADFEKAIFVRTDDLGLERSHIRIVEEKDWLSLDPKAPVVGVFFGYAGAADADHPSLSGLLSDSVAIIPCVIKGDDALSQLPPCIAHINAFPSDDSDADRAHLLSLVLENLRLLRSERRLFISYKRSDSQSVAIQLFEVFEKAGFDVFLDTRSVPYGHDFQGVLWHRMADSDIVVLLDTPNFHTSRWTMEELSRANATSIQILHLLWPKVRPDSSSAFSEFVQLDSSWFRGRRRTGAAAQLTAVATSQILALAESLRARALAARHRSLIDSFCDNARSLSIHKIAVQPERYISVHNNGNKLAVVPTIGIPRADRYDEIARAIKRHDPNALVWLLYDERGILKTWLDHLKWLDGHLPVKSVMVSQSAVHLSGI